MLQLLSRWLLVHISDHITWHVHLFVYLLLWRLLSAQSVRKHVQAGMGSYAKCPTAGLCISHHMQLSTSAISLTGPFCGCLHKVCITAFAHPVVQLLMTRPRDEWRHDVTSRYRALAQFSKEDARLQFLRILRSLPYGSLLCIVSLLGSSRS